MNESMNFGNIGFSSVSSDSSSNSVAVNNVPATNVIQQENNASSVTGWFSESGVRK